MICDTIAYPIAKLANISFETDLHPERLKIEKVIPIFKSGSKMLTSNYRPISLLSNLNKIIEKIMFTRVHSFLQNENLIYKQQFGFRPKHSTTHALINITENIKEALDNGKSACGVFVDLKKAFDTVNHEILLQKMSRYGIHGPIHKWFKSYLSNRFQFVSILGFDSKKQSIKHGVPQGSVLGPLLFLIYINDLHNAIKHSKTFLFADDTNLLNININQNKMQREMNIDLRNLCQWLLANKISLNKTKTELIVFKKPSTIIPFNKIKINGMKLQPSKSVKYLGIHIDEHLDGSAHTKILIPKLQRANGMLAKIRHYTSSNQTKSIYHSIFASHMTYGCQIWGQSISNAHINKIQTLQNNALRLVTFAANSRDHITPLYAEHNILKIKDLISLKNILIIHDYFKEKLPVTFNGFYTLQQNPEKDTPLDLREIIPPSRFNEYDLSDADIRPHLQDEYRFRNIIIEGQLSVPSYNSTKYGRNSLKISSTLCWNNLKKTFPNTDFLSISREGLKNLVCKLYFDRYKNANVEQIADLD